ncbi:MAG: hypothetical protein AMJ68_08610 [Acidithiobacillales bacterium SG8_45]|jgi:D-aspartate ligase|nr:MAG: hypothetical protein AMJ68_08610 [Acidithiobacillales bacterium SG8_45]
MILSRNDIPVVVVNCKLGGLAVMRSLGPMGVSLHGVDSDAGASAFASRYCRAKHFQRLELQDAEQLFDTLLNISDQLGRKAILIPTSDDTSLFMATYRERLQDRYMFQNNSRELIEQLISKEGMHGLAKANGIPVPDISFPQSFTDIEAYIDNGGKFPVVLKAIDGTRLFKRTGKKMVIVTSAENLVQSFRELDEPGFPNLMLQEYIPGDDDQIFIFNGYFNRDSECLAGFTGHKIRQFPIHVGCASLGVQTRNQQVEDMTIKFMRDIGYQGILDIGYRFDERDGLYKVLDINPRVGQAFRMFVAENDLDVVRTLYLDLSGQEVPVSSPREGRRWLIEDLDIISSYHYYKEGSLGLGQWLRSFRGVEEAMWFSWRDPKPFLQMLGGLLGQFFRWAGKGITAPLRRSVNKA